MVFLNFNRGKYFLTQNSIENEKLFCNTIYGDLDLPFMLGSKGKRGS